MVQNLVRLFFEFFLALGLRGPGTPFRDFFEVFCGDAFLTPVEGQQRPNAKEGLCKSEGSATHGSRCLAQQ